MKAKTTLLIIVGISTLLAPPLSGQLVTETSTEIIIEEPTVIQGVSCKEFADIYENGVLESCRLSCVDTLSGQQLPAETVVHFRSDGTIDWCFLPENTMIQAVLCRGDGYGGWQTAFHSNGELRVAWLAEDQVIQGVPCKAATFFTELFGGGAGVHFHPNGRLARCKLAEDFIVEGIAFQKGDQLRFTEDGQIDLDPTK